MGRRKSVKKSHLKLTGDNYVEKVLDGNLNNESRDCTVRALSAALEIPYWQAHRFMAKNGRRMKAGVPFREVIGRKSRVLFGHRIGKRMSPRKTVKKFLKEHPTGTFLMTVTRHAFAIRDGKVITNLNSVNQHINNYWRVTKIEKPEPKPEPKELYEPPKERSIFDVHRERIRQQNANMPEPMRAVMN